VELVKINMNDKNFLQVIFDSFQDGISILDKELNILKVNHYIEKAYCDNLPLIGKKCYEVYHGRQSICPFCPSIKTLKTGNTHTEIVPYTVKGKQTGWLELSVYPIIDEKGITIGVIEHVKNATDRVKAERRIKHLFRTLTVIRNVNQLITREHDQDALLKGACDILIKNKEYRCAWILIFDENKNIQEVYSAGLNIDNFTLKKILESKMSRCIKRTLESKKPVITDTGSYEIQFFSYLEKQGNYKQATTKLEYEGKVYGIISIILLEEIASDREEQTLIQELAIDIAFALYTIEQEKLKIEEKIKFKSVVDNSFSGLMIVDDNYRLIFVNKKLCEILNAKEDDILGHDFREFLPDESKKLVADRYIRRQRGEHPPSRYEFNILTKDGRIRRVDHASTVIKDSKGRVRTVAQIIDITDKRRVENLQNILYKITKSMLKAPDLKALTFEGFNELSELLNTKNIIIAFYNDKTDSFYKLYEKKETGTVYPFKAQGTLPGLVFHEKKTLFFEKKEIEKLAEEGKVVIKTSIPELWFAIPMILTDNIIGIIIFENYDRLIDYDKHILQSLETFSSELGTYIMHRRSEEELKRLATAIEHTAEYIIITDLEGAIQYVNPAFENITGYMKSEAVGQNPRMLQSGKHDITFYKELWNTITSGKTWRGELINRRKDGTLYYEEAVISPVFDNSGKIINFVAVKHDITEEKRLEEQYLQAQKMESIGRLAGGIAHDFNNMLNVILGYSELALTKLKKSDEIYNNIQEIYEAGKRSAELTSQLLGFARKQTIMPLVLNFNKEISQMLKMLRRLIGENINLIWLPGESLWQVLLDPVQLNQILNNLCVNARDAIEDVGKITIETSNVIFDEEYCKLHPFCKEGKYVMLAVTDDGRGMNKETIAHIFEPFFTTKALGVGTGLGLSTVYGIVKQNGGFIHVYSEPGEGSTFKLYFPRYEGSKKIEKIDIEHKHEMQNGKGEVVLIVEDDPSILKLTITMLENLGYKVLSANSTKKALTIARNYRDRIDLLITDLIMPDMNGKELGIRIKKIFPEIKIIFMSGYTSNIIAYKGVLDSGYHFIQKPFDIKTIAEKIHQVLEKN